MLLDDRLFDQEWIQAMSNEDFRMLLYLMHFATRKCGIVELNMRMLNFVANTGHMYTQEEVLAKFGNMLCMIPGKANTAIFPNWIATNWAKNGKEMDVAKNPLFKSVVQELASYGMTVDDLNAMAKMKVVVKNLPNQKQKDVKQDGIPDNNTCSMRSGDASRQGRLASADIDKMFDEFWKSYPGPRKVDKKKCRAKFETILLRDANPADLFGQMMRGLEAWKKCSTWNRDGGAFIRAPAVWLNNENWKDVPDGCDDNASSNSEISEKSDSIIEKLRKEGLA